MLQAKAFGEGRNAAVSYFEAFLQELEEKGARGEYVDPKAFEKEVRAYPDKISGPVIAEIMTSASLDRAALKHLSERELKKAQEQITRSHARAMEIMETHVMQVYQKMMEEQDERLARLQDMEEEQDVNYMRAVTLWEEYESLKYVPTWSPAKQMQNIRNIFRRAAVQREAMDALSECKKTRCRDKKIAAEIKEAQRANCRDIEELREAFRSARDKIEQLDFGDMNIFDSQLQQEVNHRTSQIFLARFKALYPNQGPSS